MRRKPPFLPRSFWRSVFFWLFSFLNSSPGPAQQLSPVYFSTAIDNGNVGGLYESVPSGYANNSQTYPLIVFIHGLGQVGSGDSTDLPLVWNYTYALPSYIHDGLFPASFSVGGRLFSFIVIMPQFKSWPGGGDVEQIINWAKAHFRVDATRIYVTGFSMGGQSVWSYASTPAYAHQSAAIVPIAGDLAPTPGLASTIAGANLPVWAFHNDSDNTVPLSYSVGWVNEINNHVPAPNPLARLTIFRATGHEGWTAAYNPAYTEGGMNIYQWMLSYTTAGYAVNNPPPVARASNDTLTLPSNTVSLDATRSTDSGGTIIQFRWSPVSGPPGYSLSDSTSSQPLLGNLVQGTYRFLLTVTDNYGSSGTDTVTIQVNPGVSPIGCKSAFSIVILGSSTAFGDGATPIDSSWANKYLDGLRQINPSYSITNLAVPGYNSFQECPTGYATPVGMPLPDTAHNITRAISLRPDAIILNLPSNDAAAGYSLASQQANFNAIAGTAAAAGIPLWVTTTQPRDNMSPSQVALLTGMRDWIYSRYGSKAIDFWDTLANPDGSIRAIYNFDGIHVNNAGHQILFQRVVAADLPDSLCIRAAQGGIPPVAHAGSNQLITLPLDSVLLDGSASSDPGGTIVAYAWRQISGPSPSILSNNSTARIWADSLLPGGYQFELRVTSNLGLVSRDTVAVTVVAQAVLKANAGTPITLTLPLDSTLLNGSPSSDSGGVIRSWKWSQVSGTSGFGLAPADSPLARLTNLVAGQYTFQLVIRDQAGDSASAQVTVTVNPQGGEVSDTQRVLIDVGGDGKTGGAPTPSPDWEGKYWNNMTNASGGVAVSGMVDTKNNPTGLSLVVLKRLDGGAGTYGPGMNFSGPTRIVGDYPVTAVQDNAYASYLVTGGSWELEGLDSTKTYQVKFWGSRMTPDLYRILEVRKAGDTAWQQYNGANNTDPSQAAVIGGIHGVSSVVFQMQVGARSTFGHISVVDILAVSGPASLSGSANLPVAVSEQVPETGRILIAPNPTRNSFHILMNDPYRGRMAVQLVSLTGQVIRSQQLDKEAGFLDLPLQSSGLPNGMYLIQILEGKVSVILKLIKQ